MAEAVNERKSQRREHSALVQDEGSFVWPREFAHAPFNGSLARAGRQLDATIGLVDARSSVLLMKAATAHTLLDLVDAARDVDEAREHLQVGKDAIDAMDEYLCTHPDICDPWHSAIAVSKDRLELRLAEAELHVTEMICLL